MREKLLLPIILITFLLSNCVSYQSAIALVTPTATLTVTPAETSSIAITPSIANSLIPTETPVPRTPLGVLPSPNGQYSAACFDIDMVDGRYYPSKIEIYNQNNELIWTVPYQFDLDSTRWHTLIALRWSNDSSKIYFGYNSSADGPALDYAFPWDKFGFQSLSITTGEIRQEFDTDGFVSYAFSPDGNSLIYARKSDSPLDSIYIRNLVTEINTQIWIPPSERSYKRIGDIRWAPSRNAFVFRTESEGGDYAPEVQTIYINLDTMEQKVIEKNLILMLNFEEWVDDQTLQFTDYKGNSILIDISSEEIFSLE